MVIRLDTFRKNMSDNMIKKKVLKVLIYISSGIFISIVPLVFASRLSELVFDTMIIGDSYVLCCLFSLASIVYCIYICKKYFFKCSWNELYMGRPFIKKNWLIVGISLPVALIAFYLLFVNGNFVILDNEEYDVAEIIIYGTIGEVLENGLAFILIYFGFVFGLLKRECNTRLAFVITFIVSLSVTVPQIGFGIVEEAAFIQTLVSNILEILAFILVTIQSGSVWSAVYISTIYNMLIGSGKFFALSTSEPFYSLSAYVLEPVNPLITGYYEFWSIENALPSMIGFIVIIIIALYLIKRDRTLRNSEGGYENKI